MSLMNLFVSVLVIGFVAFAGIFGFLFVKNLWAEELLPPVVAEVNTQLTQYGNDTTLKDLVNTQITNYKGLDFNIDMIFLMLWLATIIITFIGAYKFDKLNKAQFIVFLFIGIVLMLLGMNFLEQILSWLVTSFINDVFTASETYLPIFNFYMDNFIVINILHLAMMLLINQFSLRQEEELETYVGEDTQFNEAEEDTEFNNEEGQR